jgi:hypothetical protein
VLASVPHLSTGALNRQWSITRRALPLSLLCLPPRQPADQSRRGGRFDCHPHLRELNAYCGVLVWAIGAMDGHCLRCDKLFVISDAEASRFLRFYSTRGESPPALVPGICPTCWEGGPYEPVKPLPPIPPRL